MKIDNPLQTGFLLFVGELLLALFVGVLYLLYGK